MKVVLHFDGTPALKAKLDPHERLLPEIEVLWHVLKPVTADAIAKAPKLRLIQQRPCQSGLNPRNPRKLTGSLPP